ncbi:MAG: hypothetical protein K8W52_09670 [Deltaproteobacteria bacterium]|nr:hypothetical protein [Deltaproteobacteria bacterium]
MSKRAPTPARPVTAARPTPPRSGPPSQLQAWVKAARPVAGYHGEHVAFALSSLTLTRERAGDRTLLRLTGRGTRAFPDGGFELSSVYAILIGADGAPIIRRGHDSGRQTLLGPHTTWAHELYDEQLASAAALVYEIETRVDVRRPILAGALAAITLDADDRRPWPLALTSAPVDPLLRLSLGTNFNRGELEVWLAGEATGPHDGHRNELELDLLDASGAVIASRAMTLSIGPSGLAFNDYCLRLEKPVARAVASLVVRGRSEVRAIARVGPFTIPA